MTKDDRDALKGRTFVHFKGRRYRLVDFAIDSETLEPMVVYRQLYDERKLWVRAEKMFFETIERDGYFGPRFKLENRLLGQDQMSETNTTF